MPAALETLPVEVIEMLVASLELEDIRSLRLTSKTLAENATVGSFGALFTHKNVELTSKTLHDMVRITARGHLGCLLQYCTITGIAQRNQMQKEEVAQCSRLLAEAFDNLRRRSPSGGISLLCLRVTVNREHFSDLTEPDQQFSTRSAGRGAAIATFQVAMTALHESQLVISEHLDIFGSTERCSLSSDVFEAFVLEHSASTNSFHSLKRLTLSLSAPHNEALDFTSDERSMNDQIEAQSSFCTATLLIIPRLSGCMPMLESLDLHWYSIDNIEHNPTNPFEPDVKQGSTSSVPMTSLKNCALRGIYSPQEDLLRFLRAVRPGTLTLEFVHMTSCDSYDPVFFTYLTDADCPITEYQLDDVFFGRSLAHYQNVPGTSKFRYAREPIGPSTLTRSTDDAKDPIQFQFAGARTSASNEFRTWRNEKIMEFGVSVGMYDSCN